MLGVPVGFEIRIDLAVDDENAGRAFCDPRLYRLEVGERPHRCASCTIAAGDGREIRFGNCTMSSEKPWRRKSM